MVSREGALTRSRLVYRSARVCSAARRTQPKVVRAGRAARQVFSRQFSPRTSPWRLRSSGTRPTPAASAVASEPSGSDFPLTAKLPVAAGSSPKIASTTSLRPAPTMPAMPTISPARTERLMLENFWGELSVVTRRHSSPSGRVRWWGVAMSNSRPIICVTTRCGVVLAIDSVTTW